MDLHKQKGKKRRSRNDVILNSCHHLIVNILHVLRLLFPDCGCKVNPIYAPLYLLSYNMFVLDVPEWQIEKYIIKKCCDKASEVVSEETLGHMLMISTHHVAQSYRDNELYT